MNASKIDIVAELDWAQTASHAAAAAMHAGETRANRAAFERAVRRVEKLRARYYALCK